MGGREGRKATNWEPYFQKQMGDPEMKALLLDAFESPVELIEVPEHVVSQCPG